MDASKLENFDFELVSPERKLMSEKAWQVTIPGEEGTFGVRAGHTSLVSSIKPGVVEILLNSNSEPTKVFIAGGFADVTATNCTILAEEASMVADFNEEDIQKELHDLEGKINRAQDEIEKKRYSKQLELVKSKLSAIKGEIVL